MEEEYENIDKDDYKEMMDRCEKMLTGKKQYYFDVHEFINLIDIYFDENNFSSAEKIIDVGLQQHPSSVELKLKHIKLLIDNGKEKEGLRLLKHIESIEASNSEIHILKGICYSNIGQKKEANECFNIALSLEDESEDICEVYLTISQHYINTSNYDFALKYLIKAHNTDQTNNLVLYDIAYCYDKLFELEKSVKFYKKFIDTEPYSDNAWFNLGNVYTKMERYNDAVDAFEYAIAINDNNSTALFNLANSFANWEKYDKAIETYNEYLQYDKDNIIAIYYIGECYEKAGEYEEALKQYHQVIEADEKFSDGWYGIGITKFYQNKFEESLKYVEKAIELDNENAEYWFTYGNIYRELEIDPKAELHGFKKSIELNPYDEEFWIYYTNSVNKHFSTEKAIEILKEGSEYIEESAEIFFTLAAYLYSNNEKGESLKYLKKGLKVNREKISLFYTQCNYKEDPDDNFTRLIKKLRH